MGVDAWGFPGGLLRLDPAFAYVEPPSSWPLPRAECLTLAPDLFDLYAEYIMWKARVDESQAGIKIARTNNSLRYADDITLMAESEEELKSFWMRVKEESEKSQLKTQY